MTTSAQLYYKLCKTMDDEVKSNVVMPAAMYDAAIVFLATVAERSRDPKTDFDAFIEVTISRLAAAMRETESLIATRHN